MVAVTLDEPSLTTSVGAYGPGMVKVCATKAAAAVLVVSAGQGVMVLSMAPSPSTSTLQVSVLPAAAWIRQTKCTGSGASPQPFSSVSNVWIVSAGPAPPPPPPQPMTPAATRTPRIPQPRMARSIRAGAAQGRSGHAVHGPVWFSIPRRGRRATMRDRRLLCSVDAFIAADDALADTGPARAGQYRQDPPRGGADAHAPDRDDGLASAAAGARDLRSGDRAAGRGGGRAGDRRREENSAAPALLDLHCRGDAPGSHGRLCGHRRGATGRAPRARACVHRPAAVGAGAGRDQDSGRRHGQAAGARVDPRRRDRVTHPPVDPAQRR